MKTSKFLIIALCLFAIPVHATPPPEPTLDFIREIFALPQQGPPPIGNLPGGSGAVSSVFTRTGAVTATSGDYTCAQVTNCIATNQTNVYGAFLQDFTAATMEIPEAAGFVATVNSTIGLDTTANSEHTWVNSADAINAVEAAGITANTVLKSTDATHGLITASSCIDNATTFACTEPFTTTGSVSTGTGCTPAGSTASGGVCMTEAAATGWTGTTGFDYIRGSSTHTLLYQVGTGGEFPVGLFSATPTGTRCMQSSGTLGLIAEVTGACVAVGQTNVYGAFLQDFTSGTMEIPEAAGFTTNVNSTIGLDTTANAVHLWVNAADSLSISSAAGIVANTVTKSVDATHGLIVASSMIDNGTNVTSTDTGGYIAPVFVSNGATAGFMDYAQGTTSAAVAPCNTATSICEQAPAAVTSYLVTKPGVAPNIASYKQTDGCAAAACTESFHPVPVLLTVTGDFTDSTTNTLTLITGLSTTMPVSKAVVISAHCALLFDQATAAVSDSFGIGITGTAPTSANASGTSFTSASVEATGTLVSLASTTPTAVVTFTPSAITTVWKAELDATVEQPSNATPGVFGIYVSTSTGADNLIVKRGSYCSVIYQ